RRAVACVDERAIGGLDQGSSLVTAQLASPLAGDPFEVTRAGGDKALLRGLEQRACPVALAARGRDARAQKRAEPGRPRRTRALHPLGTALGITEQTTPHLGSGRELDGGGERGAAA